MEKNPFASCFCIYVPDPAAYFKHLNFCLMKKIVIISGLLILICLSIFLPDKMISPGDLSKGYENLNNKCFTCHQAFSGTSSTNCIHCHQLDKIGSDSNNAVVNKKIIFHKNLQTQNFMSCHTEHKGVNGALTTNEFNHSLLSATVQANCSSCHTTPANLLHQSISAKSCSSYHNTNNWASKDFNHKLLSVASLNNCSSCHKAPVDNFHQQQLSAACNSCHGFEAWKPSTFDHSKYFVFDNNYVSTCGNCHQSNKYVQYSCTNCHVHNLSNLISDHQEEEITNISKCVNCHRSGNENGNRDDSEENKNNSENSAKIKKYINKDKKTNSDEKDD